jgi:hypothetical protein
METSGPAERWLVRVPQAGSWSLADYELDELKEGFEDVVKYFPNKDDAPIGPMATAVLEKEVADLSKAIEAKDRKTFAAAFDKLVQRLSPVGEEALHHRAAPLSQSLRQPVIRACEEIGRTFGR